MFCECPLDERVLTSLLAWSQTEVLMLMRQILLNKDFPIVTAWDCFSKHLSTLNLWITVAGVTPSSCEDNSAHKVQCPLWAKNGECQKNPAFMKVKCRKSCNVCGKYRRIFLFIWHPVWLGKLRAPILTMN